MIDPHITLRGQLSLAAEGAEEQGKDAWAVLMRRAIAALGPTSEAQIDAATRAVEKIPYTSSMYVTREGAREIAVAALRAVEGERRDDGSIGAHWHYWITDDKGVYVCHDCPVKKDGA